VVVVVSSQRCGSKLYTDMDYKAKPKIGMKARGNNAYKQNLGSSCLWLLHSDQWGLKLCKHHFL